MGVNVYPGPTFRIQEFTSSGTWVCPAGVFSAEFLVVGGGGGGGSAGNEANASTVVCGAGGGGGGVVITTIPTTPGSSYTVTIGAGGAGNTSGTANAANGGTSEILLGATSLIKAFGGQGGRTQNGSTAYNLTNGEFAGKTGSINRNATQACAGGGGGGWVGGNLENDYAGTSGNGSTNSGIGIQQNSFGIYGYANLGCGGGGGLGHATTAPDTNSRSVNGGHGGNTSGADTAANGSNATANTGGGGGGGVAVGTTTKVGTGGNGADGLVRISYYG